VGGRDALIAGSDVTTMMYVVDVKFSMKATKVLLPARRPLNLACAFLQWARSPSATTTGGQHSTAAPAPACMPGSMAGLTCTTT